MSSCLPAGQATVCLVGGTDELSDISICEFANMTAKASDDGDKFAERFPMEISRPMSATHLGFAESHGTGVLVFMSGDLAIAMSVRIRAAAAAVPTATDDVGRSVPAPGQGVLGADSKQAGAKNPLSALSKRRSLLEHEIKNHCLPRLTTVYGPNQ